MAVIRFRLRLLSVGKPKGDSPTASDVLSAVCCVCDAVLLRVRGRLYPSVLLQEGRSNFRGLVLGCIEADVYK